MIGGVRAPWAPPGYAYAPIGAIGHCTESGWTDAESFLIWLKHFTAIAKPAQDGKHLIILDGQHSHKTFAAIKYARLNGIDLLTLPPHCTHKMQPLDKSFFKLLKSNYNSAANNWMVTNHGKRITFYEIAQIFAVAYNRSATVEKLVNGFRECGLWPFNNKVFSDDEFIAAAITNEPEPSEIVTSLQNSSGSNRSHRILDVEVELTLRS